jgi:hypothetical protein
MCGRIGINTRGSAASAARIGGADSTLRLRSPILWGMSKRPSSKRTETKPVGLWERTKAWAHKNRTISGAVIGFAAGTIVPWIGTVIGTIVGAGVGFASSKERKKSSSPPKRLPVVVR